jgi:hypothetical protein
MAIILFSSLFLITTFSYVIKKSIDAMAFQYRLITNNEINDEIN